MKEFIAKDTLNSEDFANFSRQCVNDHKRALERVEMFRRDIERAKRNLADWERILENSRLHCEKHGVDLSAV